MVILIDQVLKYLLVMYKPNWKIGLLNISLITNKGAGFGILQGKIGLLTLISLIVVGGIIFFYNKISSEKIVQILTALFLGGATGNLMDRLFRGYVVDFINLTFWPAFNVADACISIAAIGLIIFFWRKK